MKTGTKNNLLQQKEAAVDNKELSIDEVKELMEEQKQRSANIAQEYDGEDDAYEYDDDTLGMDDDYIDNIDSPAAIANPEEEQGEPSKLESLQKPNITDTQLQEPIITNENKPITQTSIESQSTEVPVAKKSNAEILSDSATKELDEALEEFSRVAEEEAEELTREDSLLETKTFKAEPNAHVSDPKKPRRGRPPRWLKEQTLQMGAEARKKISQTPTCSSSTIDLNKTSEVQVKGEPANQTQLINEVLKKYPNLIKDNKAVKIKVLTKDPTGKNVTKFITLKAQGGQTVSKPEPTVPDPAPSMGAFRPVEKVMYTGKRGRPKKVKPGDFDPHHEERKKINARLKRDFPGLVSQITGGTGVNEESEEDVDDIQLSEDIEEVINQDNKSDLQIQTALSGSSTNLMPTIESQNNANQIQAPAQTILMENGQLILTPGSQLPPLATFHQGQPTQSGEMIQLVTADGQLLTTMPKGKLTTFTMPATFNIMNTTPQQILAPTNTMGISQLGGMAAPPVTVSFMTMPSTSNLTGMVPVTAEMLQEQAPPTQVLTHQTTLQDSQKVVNKIVNDWDSEEDTK